MSTVATAKPSLVNKYLDPLRDCLTPEVAARIVALRADAETQDKLDEYAEKNKEGTLTPDEAEEYAAMVRAGSLISMIQAMARKALARKAS